MLVDEDTYDLWLAHYGTPRHSGRYPWGSGDNPYQRNANFRAHVLDLRKEGMTNAAIAKSMGMSQNDLIARMSKAYAENRVADASEARRLVEEKGYSKSAAARRMGINESQVRSLLKSGEKAKTDRAADTADILKKSLAEQGGFIDVGLGSEQYLGVTNYVLKNAISQLKVDGYNVHNIKVEQLGTGNFTTMQVLAPPGVTTADINRNRDMIRQIAASDVDISKRSTLGLERPVAIDPKRVMVRYADDTDSTGARGIEKDGVIELRPGVADISLGGANYAQVRINVGDTHYLKGMAVYSDDMPDGVDIVFNTNKHSTTPMMGPKDDTVLKPMKKNKETGEVDWDNPFGATIKPEDKLVRAQRHYTDADGKQKLSAINIVNEEGDWETWAPTLSSQFLSKQPESMARRQLKIISDGKKAEYDEIMSLTNPTVKKKLLQEFADECDSASVHLKAAALPRQRNHVILPVPGLSEKEIYAPNYDTGEQVALIRHPHAGRFEIPILTVNNNSAAAKKVLGNNPPDAVGINAKTAAILSGADFDGDTVLVIPTRGTGLRNKSPLAALKDFEPKDSYRAYPGMPEVGPKTGFHKQRQMGDISNLITDMTIKGASDTELAKAVKHSMVVIDAEKHNLDWRRSFQDNGIAELKTRYQGRPNAGASTLISRAKGDYRVLERKEITPDKRTGERRYIETGRLYPKYKNAKDPEKVLAEKQPKMIPTKNGAVSEERVPERREISPDPNTGERRYVETGRSYPKYIQTKDGLRVLSGIKPYMTVTTKMGNAKDANELSSGTIMEGIYANHANQLKSLANAARKEALKTTAIPYSPSARKAYAKEVAELDAALNRVKANKPRERQANLVAGIVVQSKLDANPDLREDKDHVKKLRTQALREARYRTGAAKADIFITPKQWEAIQSGAIHKSKLEQILAAADSDTVRELAMPKIKTDITPSTIARIKTMSASGTTQSDIARMLGLSVSTVNSYL